MNASSSRENEEVMVSFIAAQKESDFEFIRDTLDELGSVCTCDRPPKAVDGGWQVPGDHRKSCVAIRAREALKLLSTPTPQPAQKPQEKWSYEKAPSSVRGDEQFGWNVIVGQGECIWFEYESDAKKVVTAHNASTQTRCADDKEHSLPKQKYYVVMAEPSTIPLAMFMEQVWAKEWQFKYCRTAIIQEFDLVLSGLKQ